MTKSELKKLNKDFTCLSLSRMDICNEAPDGLRFSEELAMMLPDKIMQEIANKVGELVVPEFWDELYSVVSDKLNEMGFKKEKLFEHTVWIKGEYTPADLDTIYEELENGEECKGKTESGGMWYLGCSDE